MGEGREAWGMSGGPREERDGWMDGMEEWGQRLKIKSNVFLGEEDFFSEMRNMGRGRKNVGQRHTGKRKNMRNNEKDRSRERGERLGERREMKERNKEREE